MRIAFHVPRATFIGGGHSGDHVLVESLVSGLRTRQHDVDFVSRIDARDFWEGRLPLRRLIEEAIAVRRRIRRFSPDAWLVYSPTVTYPDLFGWWQRPKRYVLFAAAIGRPRRLPRRWRWLYRLAHRRSLGRADAVAVFRHADADRLRGAAVEPEKIHVLPPAVAPWVSLPPRVEARRRIGLDSEVPMALCVSRFSESKNGRPGKTEMLLDLVNAVESLPGVELVLVGEGKGRATVEKRAAELGLAERVRFAGSVDDVRPYFAACDVYAYPHPLDRVWVSVLEAEAVGRPVVTMRTGSAEMCVQDGRTGLLANDLDEFRAHLAALIADRRRCESMGRAARDFISKHHTIDVRVDEIEALLGVKP